MRTNLVNPPQFILLVLILMMRQSASVSIAQGLTEEEQGASGILHVFLLAGQSNMQGQGVVDLDHPQYYNGGKGTLKKLLEQDSTRPIVSHLVDQDGKWKARTDVWCRYKTDHEVKAGPLDIGFAGYQGRHHIGPELQFGHVVGDRFEAPVLIIKTAWGGKSLHEDFRPPSAEGDTGIYYHKMLEEYHEALTRIAIEFPTLKDLEPSLEGFVWMQGWNDAFGSEQARAQYDSNLRYLIADLRKEFKKPSLPIVIGELGNEGENASDRIKSIRKAQHSVCTDADAPQPIAFAATSPFARAASESPNVTHGHHWYGNAESYFLIGDALGKSMLTLID